MENIKISGSIVIYKENEEVLRKSIESFLNINFEKELIVVDNSPTNKLEKFCKQYDIKYIFLNKNVGFGKGHNIAFKNLHLLSDIHLILNPDIFFEKNEMENFLFWFKNSSAVLSIPAIFYPSGEYQQVVRKIPTFFSLIKRKFVKNYDEIFIPLNQIQKIPFAHGCFFAIKTEIFKKLQGFDERFFMYMEDIDLWIRAKQYGPTVINTNYMIYHEFRKGSSKNIKLFLYHLISAYKFFLKYRKW